SAEGIRDAASKGMSSAWETLPVPLDYVHARMRDTHDLWHAVTGYQGVVLGEASLLAFLFAQTWNLGVGLIVVAALVKSAHDPEARRTIFDGFKRGFGAEWLPGVEWET